MKRKIVVVLFAVMLAFSGCSKGETSQPEKEPEKNESVKDDAEEELSLIHISLAFDTIYAEGQRRYMESLSSYARQFLGQMEKPNVESIEGLSPAISIRCV